MLDLDQVQTAPLLGYRTLVLRRDPSQSRPPASYSLVDSGRFYDVWQRPAGTEDSVLRHLGLGDAADPAAVPSCGEVREMAALARQSSPAARLAAARAKPEIVIDVGRTRHPDSWEGDDPGSLSLVDSGVLNAEFTVPDPGVYLIWLGGSVRGEIEAFVDGEEVGSLDHQLANAGEYTELGQITLAPGRHRLELRYDDKPWNPGTETPLALPYPTGPFAVGPSEDPVVNYFTPNQAREICGRRWDWVEALSE